MQSAQRFPGAVSQQTNLFCCFILRKSSNKRVSQSCAEHTSAAPKRGLASLVGHTLLYTWRIIWKKWMPGKKTQEMERWLSCKYCAIFRKTSFCKSLKFFRTSIASGSRNSPTTSIRHTIRHVYRNVCPASLWCRPRSFCAWLWNSFTLVFQESIQSLER